LGVEVELGERVLDGTLDSGTAGRWERHEEVPFRGAGSWPIRPASADLFDRQDGQRPQDADPGGDTEQEAVVATDSEQGPAQRGSERLGSGTGDVEDAEVL